MKKKILFTLFVLMASVGSFIVKGQRKAPPCLPASNICYVKWDAGCQCWKNGPSGIMYLPN